jgi:hypothetical protein
MSNETCNCPCCREGIETPHEYHLERRPMQPVWAYEVLSVDGVWEAEQKRGEAPDAEMFSIRNLRRIDGVKACECGQQAYGDGWHRKDCPAAGVKGLDRG